MDVQKEKDGVRVWYDCISEGFDKRYTGTEGFYWENFETKIIDELIDVKNKVVLDLGCGGGRYALSVQDKVRKIIGIDISSKMIEVARKKCEPGMPIEFIVGDATNTCFRDGYFDVIVSLGMFEYLEDPSPFLIEINRILKPNGVLVFTCHNRGRVFHRLFETRFFQTVLKPILKSIRDFLFHRTANINASYYGQPAGTREKLWSAVRHNLKGIDSFLRSNGLSLTDYRSLNFRAVDTFFKIGTRIRDGKLRRSLFGISIFLNRFLGIFPLTRRWGGNLIIKAVKEAEK
jgi:ubiquinone/menaquinone biosynthesis C-methylase UbiE